MRKYLMALFERCLSEADVNSRVVFLLHGAVSAVCTVALVIGFMIAKNKEGYDMMVLAIGGSGGIAAAGRFLTKKQPDQPSEKALPGN